MMRRMNAEDRTQHTASFIIPVYNKAAYLRKFIGSLKNIPFDSEFIFVDDGSVDKSAEIVREACQGSSLSFKLIQKDNEGVSAARNLGLVYATGKYVAFLDPDDEVSEEFAAFSLNETADLLVFAYTKIDRSGRQHVDLPSGIACLEGTDGLKAIACKTGQLNSCWAKLYSHEIIRRHTLRFPLGVKVGEDVLFNLNFIDHAMSCAVSSISMVDYYGNGDSVSAKADASLLDDAMLQVEARRNYACKWGLTKADMVELDAFNDRLIRDVFFAHARNRSVPFLLKELTRAADFKGSSAFSGMEPWKLLLIAAAFKTRGFLVAVYRRVKPLYGSHSQ